MTPRSVPPKSALDRGNGQPASGDRSAARIIDIVPRRLVEQDFGVACGESRGQQVGAPQSGAVDCVMDTRITPNRAQDAVLDIVEAEDLALDRDHLFAPGSRGKQSRGDVDVLDAR